MARKAIHLGVSEYLLKPLDQEQLLEALERAKNQVDLKKKYEIIKNNNVELTDEVLNANIMSGLSKTSKHVARMIEYIQENYAAKISINDLVEQLGISATY